MDGYSIELPRFLFRPRLFEGDACNGRHEIDPVRFEPELNHFAGNSQIVDGNTEAPHAEIGNGPQYECRVLRRRPNQKVDITRVPGKAVPGNGERADHQILSFVRVQALDKLSQVLA